MLELAFALLFQTATPEIVEPASPDTNAGHYAVAFGGRQTPAVPGPATQSVMRDMDGDGLVDFAVLEDRWGADVPVHVSIYDISTGQAYLAYTCGMRTYNAETAFDDCVAEYAEFDAARGLDMVDTLNSTAAGQESLSWETANLGIPNALNILNVSLAKLAVSEAREAAANGDNTALLDALALREERALMYGMSD